METSLSLPFQLPEAETFRSILWHPVAHTLLVHIYLHLLISPMTSQLFGIVVPGRPVITEFQLVDSTKAMTMLEQPATVPELTFFLLPTTVIPPGYGAILYYSVPPFQNWVLIGSIDPSKPSGIFRTNWANNEEVRNCPVVQLGVSLEP